MSRDSTNPTRVTINQFQKFKREGRRFSAITCYDSAFARLVDQTQIDMVLVGDSLGNVMLGYENTIPVTIDHMLHHTAAVSRVVKRAFVCADMPFMSYHVSVEQALTNAGRLLAEGGAQAVKVEGGAEICPQIQALVQSGIPVVGHLGLTPQSIHSLGGYMVQGRGEVAHQKLIDNAMALAQAGVFSLVLEMVPLELARQITSMLGVPTIGIGAGPHCDGQILVLHDLLGFDDSFKPRFLKRYAELSAVIKTSLNEYAEEVRAGVFPGHENSFSE